MPLNCNKEIKANDGKNEKNAIVVVVDVDLNEKPRSLK